MRLNGWTAQIDETKHEMDWLVSCRTKTDRATPGHRANLFVWTSELTKNKFEVLLQVGEDCLAHWVHKFSPMSIESTEGWSFQMQIGHSKSNKTKETTLLLLASCWRTKIFQRKLWWFLRSIPPPVSTSTAMKFAVGPWKRYRGVFESENSWGYTASTWHRTSLLRNPSVFVNNEKYIMNWYLHISYSDIYSQINSFISMQGIWHPFDIYTARESETCWHTVNCQIYPTYPITLSFVWFDCATGQPNTRQSYRYAISGLALGMIPRHIIYSESS